MIKVNCRCGKTEKTFFKLKKMDWFVNEDCCFAAGYNALGEEVVKSGVVAPQNSVETSTIQDTGDTTPTARKLSLKKNKGPK